MSEKVMPEAFSLYRCLLYTQKLHLKLNILSNTMSTILHKLSILIVLSGERGVLGIRCQVGACFQGTLIHNRKTQRLRAKDSHTTWTLGIVLPATHWCSHYFTMGQACLCQETLQSHFYNAGQLPNVPSIFPSLELPVI